MLHTYFDEVTAEDTEHLVLGQSKLCSLRRSRHGGLFKPEKRHLMGKTFSGELCFFLPYRRK